MISRAPSNPLPGSMKLLESSANEVRFISVTIRKYYTERGAPQWSIFFLVHLYVYGLACGGGQIWVNM
jgi:hypothetical protein